MAIGVNDRTFLLLPVLDFLAANVNQKEAHDPRSAKKLTQSSIVASKRSVYTIIFIVSFVIILGILLRLSILTLVRHEVEKYPVDFDGLVPGFQSLAQRFEVSSLILWYHAPVIGLQCFI